MALDGRTGEELWTHRTRQEIFALNCNADIDNDGVKDCLSAGRTGVSKSNIFLLEKVPIMWQLLIILEMGSQF